MKIYKIILFLILAAYSSALFSCQENNLAQSEKLLTTNESKQSAPSSPPMDFAIPEGWVLYSTPKENSREIQCANNSRKEWKVEAENGNLKISKYAYEENEQIKKLPPNLQEIISKNRNIKKGLGGYLHIESFEKGWLIGSDAGEWGGSFFWFSENGTRQTELLIDNIRGIAKIADEVFILSGMSHMDTNEGKIYKLVKDEKGNPKTQLLTDLKTQPQTFTTESNQSILITLNDKIMRLKSSGELKELKQTKFNSLYPNSMAITSSNVIYVGMRLFIVRFVPNEKGYVEEWLVPQGCQKFVEQDFDCVCRNEG